MKRRVGHNIESNPKRADNTPITTSVRKRNGLPELLPELNDRIKKKLPFLDDHFRDCMWRNSQEAFKTADGKRTFGDYQVWITNDSIF